MSAHTLLRLAGLALAAGLLAGCAGPYDHALASRTLERPEPALNAADQRALAPYLNSPYFHDQR